MSHWWRDEVSTGAVGITAGHPTNRTRRAGPGSESAARCIVICASWVSATCGYGRTLEIDHIVSLELGGSNDIANLYPEKAAGYQVKDKFENRLHKLVCSGAMTQHAAQVGIASNWEKPCASVFGTAPTSRPEPEVSADEEPKPPGREDSRAAEPVTPSQA